MKATASLAIVLVAVAAACGGGSKSAPATAEPGAAEPSTAAEPAPPAEPSTGRGGGIEAARAKSTFAMYPKGVKIVAGLSAVQLRQSVLWPHLKAMIEQRASAEIGAFKDACNMDALQVVEMAEIALDPDSGEEDMVAVLGGSFTRADVERCAKAFGAQNNLQVTVTNDGAVSSYDNGSDAMWAGWPDDHTVVFGDVSHDRAWVAARLAGESSIREDEALMAVVGNVDTTATGWLAYADHSGQLGMLAPQLGGRAPTGLYAWLRVTDVAKGEIGLMFASEGDAKVAASSLETLVDQLKADPTLSLFVSGTSVGVYGTNAVLELDLNKQQLQELITILADLPI